MSRPDSGFAGQTIITFPTPSPIDELFTHYAERVASEFDVEESAMWHQPAERTLTIHEVVSLCGDDVRTETLASDEHREVAVLEFDDAIVKIVIIRSAAIFVDLGAGNVFSARSMMNAISSKIQAIDLEDREA